MPIRKKLTDKLKQKIKKDYAALKLKDFSGEALTYLRKIKALAKARKNKKELYVHIGTQKIPKDSSLYRIIELSAQSKNQSVKDFIKENPKAIERLAEKGSEAIVKDSEDVETIIDKLPKNRKIYVNGKQVSKTKAKFIVHSFKSNLLSVAEVYEKILHEIVIDLKGNLYLTIPFPEEYLKYDEEDDLLYFIDRKYPSIIYFTNSKKD